MPVFLPCQQLLMISWHAGRQSPGSWERLLMESLHSVFIPGVGCSVVALMARIATKESKFRGKDTETVPSRTTIRTHTMGCST